MKTLEFTNIADASTLTGIPYPIIYFHIKNKHLPATRLGKIFLINRNDLLAFVEARRNGFYCKAGRPKKQPIIETFFGDKKLTIKGEKT